MADGGVENRPTKSHSEGSEKGHVLSTKSLKILYEENAQLRQKLDHMNEPLLNAQRARFGQSSERTKYVMQGGTQLGLFNEAEAEQDHKAVEPTENTIVIPEHTRKAKRTVDELTANLPVKEVLITLSDDELVCDKGGGKYEMIGKKLVSRRLEVIPRQCYVVEYYSCSYACKSCETKTGYANIVTTVTPPMLMKHSLASASTVANDDAKVCGRTAFGPARKDLGTRGDLPFPCHDVQLGDPVRPDLAETMKAQAQEASVLGATVPNAKKSLPTARCKVDRLSQAAGQKVGPIRTTRRKK